MVSYRYNEREQQEDQSKPDFDLREGWIVMFELQNKSQIYILNEPFEI